MSFAGLLNQTISVKNPTATRDKSGLPGVGSSTDMAARVQRVNKVIVTAEREREPIDLIVYTAGAIAKGAQITYDGVKYRAMARSDVVGAEGNLHHYKVMAQLWSYSA